MGAWDNLEQLCIMGLSHTKAVRHRSASKRIPAAFMYHLTHVAMEADKESLQKQIGLLGIFLITMLVHGTQTT